MKTCTLFFILGLLCLNVKDLSGQEPITLEENDSWLAGTRYFQIGDGLYTPIGRNGDKLRRHLLSNADALREMDQYRSKRNTARGLVITTSVSGSILIFSGLMQSVFSYGGLGFFFPSIRDEEAIRRGNAMALSGVVVIGGGILLSAGLKKGADRHLHDAVIFYNNTLPKPVEGSTGLSWQPDELRLGSSAQAQTVGLSLVWRLDGR
ncbi:MAG: hypothetical protein KDC30_13555 [Saprospiraceae bacterium]|nr:hypothetical protein [Saprospiraceae bacterium]MCB0677717.1 hypothetical protein [Saprospiraceae bacterium]